MLCPVIKLAFLLEVFANQVARLVRGRKVQKGPASGVAGIVLVHHLAMDTSIVNSDNGLKQQSMRGLIMRFAYTPCPSGQVDFFKAARPRCHEQRRYQIIAGCGDHGLINKIIKAL
jgi:hypothetical protein